MSHADCSLVIAIRDSARWVIHHILNNHDRPVGPLVIPRIEKDVEHTRALHACADRDTRISSVGDIGVNGAKGHSRYSSVHSIAISSSVAFAMATAFRLIAKTCVMPRSTHAFEGRLPKSHTRRSGMAGVPVRGKSTLSARIVPTAVPSAPGLAV